MYITVLFHITVILVLLCDQIKTHKALESSFVLDFSRQEEIERQEQEIAFKDEISRSIDELLSRTPARSASDYRNIAVDRGNLKDDRNTDADQLYKDAARLQAELENGSRSAIEEDARDKAVDLGKSSSDEGNKASDKAYSGPSVVSYNLDGRKASHLAIPAYRCMGEGRVTVIIEVNQSGTVVNAKILDSQSSTDACLRKFAIRAARGSRFNISQSAPKTQVGDICYEFIAQ